MQASGEGMKDDTSETAAKRKTSVAILISDKTDFKSKNLTRQRWTVFDDEDDNASRRHQQINIIYAPNIGTPKYIKQLTDLKGETDSNTIIVRDSNTPLTSLDRSSRQKVNKETAALNETLNQIDLIDLHRAVHPNTAEFIFFSTACRIFSGIDHMLGHKSQ